MNDSDAFLCGLVTGLVMAVLLVGVAIFLGDRAWQKDAVKHGYAHYNTTNAVWQWNNQPEAAK